MRRVIAVLAVAGAGAACADGGLPTATEGPGAPAFAVYSPGTVTVQPTSTANEFTEGWLGYGDRVAAVGVAAIVAEPATQILGSGSLRIVNTAAAGGWEVAAPLSPAVAPGTPLSAITALAYSTYRPSGQAGITAQHVSLQITVDYDLTDASNDFQGRLVYEPYHCNAVPSDTWSTWNTLEDGSGAGCWWQTANPAGASAPRVGGVAQTGALACPQGNPCTWAEVKAAYPNAGFHATNAATGIILKAGSGWAGTFYTDRLVVGVNGTTTTYDFEPATPCTMTCYVNGTSGDDAFGGDTPGTAKKTIQAAVNQVSAGGSVIVAPGTYSGKVTIAGKNLTLVSTGGRAVTTIIGPDNDNTVQVSGTTTALTIGGASGGFTIIGKDNAAPGLERAAVYIAGTHSGLGVIGNEIVAGGEAALISEFGAVINGLAITGNVFSGQTFVGTPAGDGFSQQFTLHNVPRQLVVVGGGSGGGNTQNVTFTNNVVSGTAGGTNGDGNPQGNNLVTIDANGATISGNEFTGVTTRFAHSLRARGPGSVITQNQFTAGTPVGVYIGAAAASTSSVTRNAIVGNTVGLQVEPGATLNATCNWWGSLTGPASASNPAGTGDPAVGPAQAAPWLLSSNLAGACATDTQGPISSPTAPAPAEVGTPITVAVELSDATTGGSPVVSYEWFINGVSQGTVAVSPAITVNTTRTVAAQASPTVLDVCFEARDVYGNTGPRSCVAAVWYDPSAGFVTGGGWIESPAGACRKLAICNDVVGKANFGFNSQYKRGSSVPEGNTQFTFSAGNVNFHSTSYDWMVIAGSQAQYRGSGTLNGVAGYEFRLTAVDGGFNKGKNPDTFRIQIWDRTGGEVSGLVYDNGSLQVIGGGNIVIHAK